ncbi:MAG: hypothetical protein JW719_04375 [Pirellulales bacterium]|nr:hypothetical protein [Pirellulales bacterium]
MSTRYLLPCSCGRSIPVETTQAGQMVSCACGKTLEVPTLLKLRSLEPVADQHEAAVERSWGGAQGLAIVGGVVTLIGVAGLAFFFLYRPVPPKAVHTEKNIARGIENLTLIQSEGVWEQLRHGLGGSGPVDPAYRAALKTYWISKYATVAEAYEGAMKQYRIRLGVGLVVLALGVAMTTFGLVRARSRTAG